MAQNSYLSPWKAFYEIALLILIDDRVASVKLGFLDT